MKNLLNYFLLFFTLSIYSQGVVSVNGRLKVQGNQIQNDNNTAFSIAGNSFFWSGYESEGGYFYQREVVDYLAKTWNSQVVRAAMAVEQADGGRGYVNNPNTEVAKVRTVVDAAIANDIYAIIDFHSHNAEKYLSHAKTFFTQMVREYGNNDNIIYEIYNEPVGGYGDQTNTWNNIIKPYADQVIKVIRDEEKRLGYSKKLIIVGTPFYSQGVDVASKNPINNSTSNNIAYTLHFYAGSHSQSLRDKAKTALNNGIALFATEWGSVNANGDGNADENGTNTWMRFLKQNNISHANWSISDKPEGASIIKARQRINGLTSNNLTPSGNLVRCIINKWNTENNYTNCSISNTPPPPTPGEENCNKEKVIIPSDDAYLQRTSRFNNGELRTENNNNNNRVSYIKFTVPTITETIKTVKLELTVSNDSGNGIIQIFKGNSNNWTEKNLSNSNKPLEGTEIGSLNTTYSKNKSYQWLLSGITSGETITLIVKQTNGNDVSFSSKEGSVKPKLILELDCVSNRKTNNILGMKIFPNPVEGFVTVSGIKKGEDIVIYDLLENVITRKISTGNQETINISNIKAGIYIIKVSGKGSEILIKK